MTRSTLCNWVWPMAQSPSKSRNYRGDLDLEAKFYKAVTGEDITTDELYKRAAKIMTLQRANTVRGMTDKDGKMGCNDCRTIHDVITEWPFTEATRTSSRSPRAPTRWRRKTSRRA